MSNISDINSSKPLKGFKKDLVKDRKKTVSFNVNQNADSENRDKVSISGKHENISKSETQKIQDWAAEAMAIEEDSESRILQAKERLESGYYDKPDVLKVVAERINEEIMGE